MTGTKATFRVGDMVRYAHTNGDEKFAYGRVSAVETYRDDHGRRVWYYVRWIDANGKPDSNDLKHSGAELEAYAP